MIGSACRRQSIACYLDAALGIPPAYVGSSSSATDVVRAGVYRLAALALREGPSSSASVTEEYDHA